MFYIIQDIADKQYAIISPKLGGWLCTDKYDTTWTHNLFDFKNYQKFNIYTFEDDGYAFHDIDLFIANCKLDLKLILFIESINNLQIDYPELFI